MPLPAGQLGVVLQRAQHVHHVLLGQQRLQQAGVVQHDGAAHDGVQVPQRLGVLQVLARLRGVGPGWGQGPPRARALFVFVKGPSARRPQRRRARPEQVEQAAHVAAAQHLAGRAVALVQAQLAQHARQLRQRAHLRLRQRDRLGARAVRKVALQRRRRLLELVHVPPAHRRLADRAWRARPVSASARLARRAQGRPAGAHRPCCAGTATAPAACAPCARGRRLAQRLPASSPARPAPRRAAAGRRAPDEFAAHGLLEAQRDVGADLRVGPGDDGVLCAAPAPASAPPARLARARPPFQGPRPGPAHPPGAGRCPPARCGG